jgi:hypothetical protein
MPPVPISLSRRNLSAMTRPIRPSDRDGSRSGSVGADRVGLQGSEFVLVSGQGLFSRLGGEPVNDQPTCS